MSAPEMTDARCVKGLKRIQHIVTCWMDDYESACLDHAIARLREPMLPDDERMAAAVREVEALAVEHGWIWSEKKCRIFARAAVNGYMQGAEP